MSTTTATETQDQLYDRLQRADLNARQAAAALAYDVTFRADAPNGPGHQKASAKLTAKLKAEYRAAHDEATAIRNQWNDLDA